MRDLLCTSALVLVLAAGAAGAQTLPPNERAQTPNMQQPSPQSTEQQNQGPSKSNAMRDGAIAPSEDKIGGPPESEAGQRDSKNLAGSTADDATGTHRDMAEIPGATPQTMPAKYSKDNADRAEYSIMGYPIQLSDQQKQAIWQAIGEKTATANEAGEKIHAEAGVFLPRTVEGQELPQRLHDMAELRGLKYVKTDDKVLLVQPSNRIVRGVIEE